MGGTVGDGGGAGGGRCSLQGRGSGLLALRSACGPAALSSPWGPVTGRQWRCPRWISTADSGGAGSERGAEGIFGDRGAGGAAGGRSPRS